MPLVSRSDSDTASLRIDSGEKRAPCRKKNASLMLNSSLCKEILEQDNGHSSGLDQRKSGTPSLKTVHTENGTKLLS